MDYVVRIYLFQKLKFKVLTLICNRNEIFRLKPTEGHPDRQTPKEARRAERLKFSDNNNNNEGINPNKKYATNTDTRHHI